MADSLPSTTSGLPPVVACRHVDSRDGFEVMFARRVQDGHHLEGQSTGVEEGVPWAIRYELSIDSVWVTRFARAACRLAGGGREVVLEGDGSGGWRVDGEAAPALDGCLDVDLEASGLTNLLPVRRLGLAVGERAEAPAAWLRIPDLRVERLEQSYERLPDEGERARYDYLAPASDFGCVITYDPDGVVRDYPEIAVRVV